ncbi:hypothetical protein Dimus_025183, partial [Dionaea muscipula]
ETRVIPVVFRVRNFVPERFLSFNSVVPMLVATALGASLTLVVRRCLTNSS